MAWTVSFGVWLCTTILLQFSSGIYIQNVKQTENVIDCPYECYCDFQKSFSSCDNGFSVDSVSDKSLMFQLKTLSIKRVEEVLLQVNFEKFTNLEKLDLSSNVITVVPDYAFQNNVKLRTLILKNNFILSLNDSVFSALHELTSLDLSNNNIQTIDLKLFDDLENLVYLNLSSNAISGLPIGIFKNLKNLKNLDLSSNNIAHLSIEMLEGLTSLQTLNMSRNELVTVSREIAYFSERLVSFIITKNNFDCSCELDSLLTHIATNPTKYGDPDDLICDKTFKLMDLGNETLPCLPPEVTMISNSTNILIRESVLLQCKSFGHPSSLTYWKTPLGTIFCHESIRHILKSYNVTAISYASFHGCDVGPGSKVTVTEDGSLYINSMRGFFRGKFTCVAVNGIGSTNATLDVDIYAGIVKTRNMSLIFCAGCAFLVLMIGIVIGSISLCVQKCSCCSCCQCCSCAPIKDEVEDEEESKEFKFTIENVDEELKHATLESCNSNLSNGSYYSDEPPGTPFNSPIEQTPRASPRKCPTPNAEMIDKSKSPNTKNTLDEVKVRLEKKMEKVRGHYHSIKESGSVYLTNIKDTGNQAAIKVKAGVVIGMEQVKYGYKSIREFCGTGEMGNQTISSVSFSTNPNEEMSSEESKMEVKQEPQTSTTL